MIVAVLWDMDGTLVDSIGAVETAWGSVAVRDARHTPNGALG
jgi:beta-phosphoglucomutase-like phosphatase (HAD superfamily)